jgi:histidinol-phosphatase
VIKKVDRSPVTRADKESEQVMRQILQKAHPEHQLCGEEYGWDKEWNAEYRWWLDPVDGTRQFVRGLPNWGTLVALEHRGKPVVGVMHHPAAGLTVWAARGMGCFANGKKVRVSDIPSLSQGTLLYGAWRLFLRPQRARMALLVEGAYDERGFGDSFSYALLVQGRAEAMVDPVVQPYDVAAAKVCVEEAGGKFTDLSGRSTHRGGSALASNGRVHGEILRALKTSGKRG